MVALRYAARSDIGLGRRNNQDSAYAGTNLLVVADGMGGHAGGDVASSLAIGRLAALDNDAPGADALQELEAAILAAGTAIRDRVVEEPALASMGTTVTAILRHGRRLALAHIGDSRAYLLRDGELTQVTADHTFVQHLVDEGRITSEEATQHPQRNIVMRVIGDVDAPQEVDSSVREAVVGDRWLLCSDGLSGPVSHDTLAETLRDFADPAECADKLIDLALRAGGTDNITCVVADVVRESQTATTTTPEVVGAAATTRDRPTSAPTNSAAAKAAALTRPAPTGEDEVEYADDEEIGRRPWRAILGGLLVVGLIGLGIYGAWAWSQAQYFVGVNKGNVAIYSGLSDDLGSIKMSNLHTAYTDLPVDTLPSATQAKVRAGLGADDLADAKRIVSNLYKQSSVCSSTQWSGPTTSPTSTTSPTTSPTSSSPTGTASATTAPSTATPTPIPTPSGCNG